MSNCDERGCQMGSMKLTSEVKKIGVLGIILGFIGFLGSVASIFADFGIYGVIVSFALAFLLFGACILVLKPVLVKNKRGVTMLEAITNVGLVDIENRDDRLHLLPPTEFYELARNEIVITGVSAFRTFDQHSDILCQALDAGKELYVLILHPDSPDVERLTKREGLDIREQIMNVIHIISNLQLNRHPGFHIRFMQKLPPFTAVMIDGDVFPTGKEPRDQEAQIRVQPTTVYGTQHSGVILQFKKKSGQPAGAFDCFAEDVRNQWLKDGRETPELFA